MIGFFSRPTRKDFAGDKMIDGEASSLRNPHVSKLATEYSVIEPRKVSASNWGYAT